MLFTIIIFYPALSVLRLPQLDSIADSFPLQNFGIIRRRRLSGCCQGHAFLDLLYDQHRTLWLPFQQVSQYQDPLGRRLRHLHGRTR